MHLPLKRLALNDQNQDAVLQDKAKATINRLSLIGDGNFFRMNSQNVANSTPNIRTLNIN
jgi:hypothetical protein